MRFAASGAEDGMVRVWELTTGHEKWCSATLEGNVFDVAFSSDTRHIAAAVERGYFRVWESTGFQVTHELHGPGGLGAAVAPGLDAMAFAGYPQTDGGKPLVLFCDIGTGKITRLAIPPEENKPAEPMEQIRSLAFSRDGKLLAVGCTHYIGVWNATESRWMWHDSVDNSDSNGIWKIAFCPRGLRLAAILHAREAGGLRILSAENGQELLFITTPGRANALAWSADGERLALGLDDDSISVFDTASWQCVATFSGHDEEINCVAFVGPHQVLSGSKDRTLRLWDLRSAGQRPLLPDPKTAALLSSGFACDGTKLW
jgi:WD40 repeat protein